MHQTQHLHNYGFPFYGICGKIQSNFSLCLPLPSHRQLLKFFSYKFTFLLQSISFCPFHLIHIYRPFECFARSFPIMANGKFHRIGKNMCKNESFRHAVLLSSRFLSLSYFLWMSQATRQIVIRTNNHPREKKIPAGLQVCTGTNWEAVCTDREGTELVFHWLSFLFWGNSSSCRSFKWWIFRFENS